MIVVFDAKCLLCSRWVPFLLKHDRKAIFKFASIQSQTGQSLLSQAGLSAYHLKTLLLVEGAGDAPKIRIVQHWQNTAAIFRIFHALGWPWRLAWIAYLIPSPLRDSAYHFLARNRYRFFGRSEACMLPAPSDAARFLP